MQKHKSLWVAMEDGALTQNNEKVLMKMFFSFATLQ